MNLCGGVDMMWFKIKSKLFDNISSVRSWFMDEVEKDPNFVEDELGDRCFHYSHNMEVVRNEEWRSYS